MKTLLGLVGWLAGLVIALASPIPIYQNPGTNPDPIMIDATVFENTGVFNIGAPPDQAFGDYRNPVVPFETQNTLYYTNTGTMTAVPGFNLQYIDDGGNRKRAAQIYNGPGATIAGDFANLSVDISGWPDYGHPLYGGFLNFDATNVISRGSISGFYAGAIEIHGENVDLSGSKLGNSSLPFSTFATFDFIPNDAAHTETTFATPFGPTFFDPETDVRDIWWRYGNSAVVPTALAVAQGPNLIVDTGRFGVYVQYQATPAIDDPANTFFTRLVLVNPATFVFTNQPSATNKLIEVVFVDNPDTNVFIDVSWQQGPNPLLPSRAAYVRFTTIQPDLVNQGVSSVANQFVLADSFGPEPLAALLDNSLTLTTQDPTNLVAFRAFPPVYIPGVPIGSDTTNSDFSPDLFTTWYDDAFPDGMLMTNQVTTNLYVTYAAQLKPFPSDILNNNGFSSGGFIPGFGGTGGSILNQFGVTAVPGASITNVAGRVSIDAANLNLRSARIQGQGMVSIRTDNLKSSRGAVIDAPILNYDLGTTNGLLVVKDLAKGSVSRFGGNFYIWSTTFTNTFDVTGTNSDTGGGTTGTPIDIDGDGVPDGCDTDGDGVIDIVGPCPTDTGGGGTATTTNYIAIYHVMVIRNTLNSGGRSFLNDLRLRAPKVDVQDEMIVDGGFSSTATNLTVSGSLNLIGVTNLTGANLPSLSSLTINSGATLAVPSFIGLGLPPNAPLDDLANAGAIQATGVNIVARQIENSGTILANGGDLQLAAVDFVNNGGGLNATHNLTLNAVNANLAGLTSTVGLADTIGGAFTLNVTGNLTDGGTNLPGMIQTAYGIILPVKPATGDLPGTTIGIKAPDYTESQSFWSANDVGPTRAGYTNNASLGVLSLDIGLGGVIIITPVNDTNAIYVERLDLSDAIAADLENALDLPEGMTLYYASTSDNVNPADLDGFVTVGGGTLRWVKDGSGGVIDSTVSVRSGDGRILRVPRALRFSTTLDSDGDGVVNADDSSPFDLVVVSRVTLVNSNPPAFRIQWSAAPGQTYEVQATTDLRSGQWPKVTSVHNVAAGAQEMTVDDPVDPGAALKAYRVIVQP